TDRIAHPVGVRVLLDQPVGVDKGSHRGGKQQQCFHFVPPPASIRRHVTLDISVESMPARVSETFVLRTYPFREADLIVSFFTRDLGKLRGVARRARRPKSPFGSGLERLSQVRMAYFQKENAELVNLSGCELIESQFGLQSEYAMSVVLDYFTEVAEQLLPANEPNEKFFRLLASMLAFLRE